MSESELSRVKRWSMFPDLARKVLDALQDVGLIYTFNPKDDEDTCIEIYDTNIRGRFNCHNKTCSSPGWFSNIVPITIRLYSGQRYNARVYYQRCGNCQTISRPLLDDSYFERVAYRIKRWAGVAVEIPPYNYREKDRPHQSENCEGCLAGHCKKGWA